MLPRPLTLLIGTGFAAAAIGVTAATTILARTLISIPKNRRPDVAIREVDESSIELATNADTVLPGRYALRLAHDVVPLGEVLEHGASTVRREFSSDARARLGATRRAFFSGWYLSHPSDITNDWDEVPIDTALGVAPAWRMGAETNETWAIHIHGRAVQRGETVRGVGPFLERGISNLLISYRNDGEAPFDDRARYRLGEREWRDVEAAIAFARDHGADNVVLVGWSMGGQIALQTALRSRFRRMIQGVVLESPVVAWDPTLHHQLRALHLPKLFAVTAGALLRSRLASVLTGSDRLDLRVLNVVARADQLRAPILLLHSIDDGFVPATASRELARARPDIVTYVEYRNARHTKLWNINPAAFERSIGAWIDANIANKDR
ncbi:alpha/beta hydrolase family protein [Humidisolicoccus flavus]|uniref:alpha/beta hydrolase family protein n=1 Tax=Humidisolicoccus flavus TaxID=3111414 RepID=UPI00324F8DEB